MDKMDIMIEYLGLDAPYYPPCGENIEHLDQCRNCTDNEDCQVEYDARKNLELLKNKDKENI